MKDRVALWDNLKFLMITLVVVGHFADCFTANSDVYSSLFLFIYAFHIPVFLFISGMFHSNKNIMQKFLFFISAGFLQKIAFTILDGFLGHGNMGFSLLSEGGIPWFMFVLAIYTVLLYALRNQNKVYILAAAIVLSCFVGFDHFVGDFLYLSRTIVFFPFYLAGSMIKSDDVIEFKEKHKWLPIASVAVLLVWVIVCFTDLDKFYSYRYLFSGKNPFFDEFMKTGPMARLSCYVITLLTGAAVVFLTPNRKIPLVSSMGTRSIDVYFWHWIVYMLLDNYLHISDLFFKGVTGKLAFLTVAVAVSIILSLGGIFSFPLKQIKKYCYYKPVKKQE